MTKRTETKTAVIMAGGTGGHIFPGVAVAQGLQEAGWRVVWIGGPSGMEGKIVAGYGFDLHLLNFSGVRGKGWRPLLALPDATLEARKLLREINPDVALGFGGYVSVPGALAALSCRIPLFIHEQNAVPGMANKWLSHAARRVFTAFPKVLKGAEWVGNPLRPEFLRQGSPSRRFANRTGALRLLVVGGSLGAQALNDIVPKALALIPQEARPQVLHQGGVKQIDELQANYARAGVEAELVPFIKDTAQAYADADIIICRAGASTVTEIAAVGAAACFVPYPHAVDDHQTANARYLVNEDAAWLIEQKLMTPEGLADFLRLLTRDELQRRARQARKQAKTDAVQDIVRACVELID